MKVLLVIVTYNGEKWIEECIKSVLESSLRPDIFVVDNYSLDSTVSIIKSKYSNQVFLHESDVNLGFGKGNNIGLKYALKANYDYVFLLNQDAFLEKNTLERLINIAEKNNDYGILSPIHLNVNGIQLEWYFSGFVDFNKNPKFYSDFVMKNTIKEVYEFNFISAAAWLLPRNTLKSIGGFDPIFWHYGEDNNYCQRVLFHNLKIGVVTDTFVKHDTIIRNYDAKYFYTDRYYHDYVKNLQTKYANLNYSITIDVLKYEKKKLLKEFISTLFTFNIKHLGAIIKKYTLLSKAIPDIVLSRQINSRLKPNYLD